MFSDSLPGNFASALILPALTQRFLQNVVQDLISTAAFVLCTPSPEMLRNRATSLDSQGCEHGSRCRQRALAVCAVKDETEPKPGPAVRRPAPDCAQQAADGPRLVSQRMQGHCQLVLGLGLGLRPDVRVLQLQSAPPEGRGRRLLHLALQSGCRVEQGVEAPRVRLCKLHVLPCPRCYVFKRIVRPQLLEEVARAAPARLHAREVGAALRRRHFR
jgi:hypothetical protein